MKKPAISVIISTYNSETWLEKVLWGYQNQDFRDFEVVIADDGSGPNTRFLIEKIKSEVFFPLIHVWHKDDGFQKTKILNRAIQASNAHYILMSDGDCIPRKDFVAVHNTYKQKGYFLSGGYFKLPMHISLAIDKNDIFSEKCFQIDWLKKKGLKKSFKNNKITSSGLKSRLLNFITPTTASWNGHNASGWKEDMLAVNGFDERMQYGAEDREFGERLFNYGIKSKQIRYSAICVHLDHKRGYVSEEALQKNRIIRKHTKNTKSNWTPHGIIKGKRGQEKERLRYTA